MGDQRLPLVGGGGVHRGRGERVVLGALVVQHQEPVPAADHGVLEGVLDAVAAGRDDPELPGRVVRVEHRVLRGGLGLRDPQQEAVAAGAAEPGPEPLVGLVVHDHVVGHGGAQHVPPDLVRAPRVVGGGVEQRAAPPVPGAAAEGVGHLVGQHLAGAQVLDPEQVALVADHVGAEREQPAVGADRDPAEGEELVALGQLVGVDQHLLAGDRDVGLEGRRGPVVGPGHRAAAAGAVLLVLVGAAVVPPVADPVGHRQVGLQGVRLDLGEDLLAQAVQVGGAGLGVGVLGLEVGQRLRRLRVAQPLVLVDEGVAVVGALVRHALRDGWGDLLLFLDHAGSLRWTT